MKKRNKEIARGLLVICVIISMCFSVFALGQKDVSANYPKGQIEMIVPYSAGGGTDNAARIIADALTKELGTKVVVINRPGAGGEIGFEEVSKAKADGYTIGLFGSPDYQYLNAVKQTSYNLSDFDYLAVYNLSLPIIVAKKDSFKTIQELFEYGKKNQGKVTIGESGGGPKIEAAMTMFYGNFEGTIVTLPGAADSVNALLGGHIMAACLTPSYLPTLMPQGCVPLAYFSKDKVKGYEDIPSFAELGFNVNMAHNPVLVMPSGCPAEVKATLVKALEKIGADPEIKEKFEKLNTLYSFMSGEKLTAYLDGISAIIDTMVGEYKGIFVKK